MTIPSIFTEKVCEFPSLAEELKEGNKFQSFLSNCFNKLGHKIQIIIIKCEVLDYPIPKSLRKDMRNIILHSGNVFFMPCSFHNWTEEYYRDIKRLQTPLGGKDFTSLFEDL